MTSSTMDESSSSSSQLLPFLLLIPVELRLQIYDYAAEHRSVTLAGTPGHWNANDGGVRGQDIWAAEGFRQDLMVPAGLQDSITVKRAKMENGTWKSTREVSMEDVATRAGTTRPAISIDQTGVLNEATATGTDVQISTGLSGLPGLLYSNIQALHLVHPQIHAELLEHRPQYDSFYRHIDMTVSYPAGITILADQCPHLLKLTKSLTILGHSTFDETAMAHFDRAADMNGYVWEKVNITNKEGGPISGDLMLARHQINSLAIVVARLLGKTAHDEEESYRDLQRSQKPAPDLEERRLSFSSIPREPAEPEEATPPSSATSTSSTSVDLGRSPTSDSILTIDPPPQPRSRHSSPGPPLPNTPILHFRVFHPRKSSSSHYTDFLPAYVPGATPVPRPAPDPYRQVWSHVFSPVTMVMSNIYGGHIALSCARGEKGVGVAVIAKGNGGMGRQVSSRWPGLDRNDEGRGWLFEASAEKEMREVCGTAAVPAAVVPVTTSLATG